MDANEATMLSVSRQMQLRSQGPINLLDTTLLNPARSYVRSYDFKKRYNVNASYYTVSLQIKERRRELVVNIVAILGNDSRYWFASSLRPINLPTHPLDWSTTLLQQLCTFAESLPLDIRNTAIDQRIGLAHRIMLTEAANSSKSDSTADSANTCQPDKVSEASDKNEEPSDLRFEKVETLDELRALRDEIANMAEQKSTAERDNVNLKDQLKHTAEALSKCEAELEALREENAWTERSLAMRDRVQTVLTEHQRAFGFF